MYVNNQNILIAVYGTLERLKFFWPYLSNKNPNIGKHDETPYNFASYHRLSEVIQFMLKNGSPDQDGRGWLPMEKARFSFGTIHKLHEVNFRIFDPPSPPPPPS